MKLDDLELMSAQDYASVLKKELPSYVFQTVPSRLFILLLHSLVVFFSLYYSVASDILFLKILLSIVAGHSLGVIGFIGHEALHGTIIRNRKWQYIIGGYCLLPLALHPKVWKVWHNNQHHKHTQNPVYDPDCFGHIMLYRNSPVLQFIEKYLPGSKYFRSVFFLFYWYLFHTAIVVFYYSKNFLDKKTRWAGQLYFIFILTIWIAAAIYTGGLNHFIFLFLIPVMISNLVMMSYISTQHFLSPLTSSKNDPLINSLTVRSLKWIEKLHVNTGYHAEHHIFPNVNPKYAPIINREIKKLWPNKLKEMNHIKALRQLYKTPRFYSKWNVLQSPRTGEKFETIYSDMNNSKIHSNK
jgi:fatty acid desaturase